MVMNCIKSDGTDMEQRLLNDIVPGEDSFCERILSYNFQSKNNAVYFIASTMMICILLC